MKFATCLKPSARTTGGSRTFATVMRCWADSFEQAWLRDNRPYWLANNRARYEGATQLWIGRGDRWSWW